MIYRTLCSMREQAGRNVSLQEIEMQARRQLEESGFSVDYAEIRRGDLTRPVSANEPALLALIAARLGRTRLIDNLEFDPTPN
jgi:pantoate--beta-alanine ligase